jgi:hypothetical protein
MLLIKRMKKENIATVPKKASGSGVCYSAAAVCSGFMIAASRI